MHSELSNCAGNGLNEFGTSNKLMMALKKLHDWEINNIPCTQTTSGRMLYFSVGKNITETEIAKPIPMKTLFNSDVLTEKALRNRAFEMEMDDMLEIKRGVDARSRMIFPTRKMKYVVNAHSNEFINIMTEYFYLIPK